MRTLAPFGRRLARVAAVERIGEYGLLWAEDADGPARSAPRPVLHAGRGGALGRGRGRAAVAPARVLLLPRRGRPARLHPRGRRAGHAPARGARERRRPLADRARSASASRRPTAGRPLLVGGGIGVAPILCWSDELGHEARVLLGFRSAGHAEAASLFRGEVALATDDGSAGTPRLRDRAAARGARRRRRRRRSTPAARRRCSRPCAPSAPSAGCRAQLAMESGMACGFGACFGCVVPDAQRLRAAVRRRPGRRRRRARDRARPRERALTPARGSSSAASRCAAPC